MTANDIVKINAIHMDDGLLIFLPSTGVHRDQCDACGRWTKRGYTLRFIDYESGKVTPGAWSCSLACCAGNAQVFEYDR